MVTIKMGATKPQKQVQDQLVTDLIRSAVSKDRNRGIGNSAMGMTFKSIFLG